MGWALSGSYHGACAAAEAAHNNNTIKAMAKSQLLYICSGWAYSSCCEAGSRSKIMEAATAWMLGRRLWF